MQMRLGKYSELWPIDPSSDEPPINFSGWPEKKRFSLVLSHDVDTQKGHDQCEKLMQLEESLGFRSSFNFVPERYKVSIDLIKKLKSRGFEVCVHGLKHDGKLFSSKKIFEKRAKKINEYIKQWDINGFTAPSMICNLSWIHELNIKHSTCTFDTDPFEPTPVGSKTIFPFIVNNENGNEGFVELPYTLPQDHCLYIILKEKNNEVWKRKLDWIAQRGGMALLNTHPDYMNFTNKRNKMEEYSIELYSDFLKYVLNAYADDFWHALPEDVANFIKS